MADSATTPAPGTHPDAVAVNDNGSVTAHGRKAFVWVHDEETGSRYDVPATMLPRRGLRVVDGYPVNTTGRARAPKTALLLGDSPATAGRAASAVVDGPVDPKLAAARAAASATGSTTDPQAPVLADQPAAAAGETTDAGDAAGAGDTTTTKPRRAAR